MEKFNRGLLLFLFLFFSLCLASMAGKAERRFVRESISSNDIVIFSKSYCPYCKRAKSIFKQLNKTPHVIELDERDDGSDIQDALGQMFGKQTVPQVFINGKRLGGSDDTVEAYESGELAKLLGNNSGDDL
ncbi:glutaredoxin-C4 [Amborella trichopoda]|nr:glutaredoxin-C4 [Amborella trichopoda]|eukprot:XP_006845740.2 glutaredoxin-C4 [Amborella trichopoda]